MRDTFARRLRVGRSTRRSRRWAACGATACRYWDHAHGRCGLPPGARAHAVRGEELTLDQVGKRFGLTRERIRQIEAGALRKIGHDARGPAIREVFELCEERPGQGGLADIAPLTGVHTDGQGLMVRELSFKVECTHPAEPCRQQERPPCRAPLPPSLAAMAKRLGR